MLASTKFTDVFGKLLQWLGLKASSSQVSTAFRRKPLTVSRPFHLADYFEPVESRSEIESFFSTISPGSL